MPKMKRLLDSRAALALGTWIVYTLAIIPLYRLAGPLVLAMATIPVIVTGWLFGTWAGVLASLLALPLNMLLLILAGEASWGVMIRALPGSAILVLVGAVVGRLRDLGEQVKRELTERKLAEEEINRLAKFPSQNPNLVLRVARDGTILYANEASLPLLNVWGRQTGQPLPDDWREFALDALSSGLSKEAEVEYEDRILSLMFASVVDADYINVYGLDITERVRAEERIRQQNEFLNSILESLTYPFYVVDANDYTIKMANSAAHVGRISEDSTCYALTHGQSRPCTTASHPCPIEEMKKTKKPIVVEHVHYDKDGNARQVEVHGHPLFDSEGNLVQVIEYSFDITERVRAEEALRESEERYRELVNTSVDGVISIDPQMKIIVWNPGAQRIFGYTEEEMLGQTLMRVIPERYREAKERGFAVFRKTGSGPVIGKTLELEGLRKDGTDVPVELSVSSRMLDGTYIATAMMRDITERKRAEEALAKRTHDLGERVKELNCLYGISELIEKPDISSEELIRGIVGLIPPVWQYPEVTCARIILEGEELRTENFRETTWKQSSDIVVHGQRVGTLEVCYLEERPESDEGPFLKEERNLINAIAEQLERIIERKQAEGALRESEARIRSVLNTTVDGIITIDERGVVETFNPAAERIFGYQATEVIGQNINRLMPKPFHSQHDGYISNYLRTGKAKIIGIGREVVGRRKDGTTFPMDLAVSEVRLGDRRLFTGIVRDITKRKQAAEALKEYSERLEDMVEERTRELREAQAQLLAQQRLQQEIELAAEVQTSLLPRGVPSLEGFDFAATALPARYVSGDMYDFTRCGPETCHIVLADIAGKGIPAALLTSTARALMRAETEHEDSPATILSNVNTSLYEDLTHAEVFITFLAARLNARLGTLTYANAGHTETLWWQRASRTCRTLPATGLPMGIYADLSILEETLALRPGDALVFYSDGITEAANPHDELFGLDRLIATVGTHVHLSASELAQAIVKAVEAFRAGAPLSDDLTLIVLKVLPRTISFAYPATLDHLNEMTTLVQQVASAYGSDFAYQMELATSEIVTNVIEHAYRLSSGEMRGQITLLPDQIQLDLYDDGTLFDPSLLPPPDLGEPCEGGYGLFVARQLADELTYNPATPDGNHWRLIKLAGNSIRNSPDSPGDDP